MPVCDPVLSLLLQVCEQANFSVVSGLHSTLQMLTAFVAQAEQLRKSAYVPEPGIDYDPDKHLTCTIYAGSMVSQVSLPGQSFLASRHTAAELHAMTDWWLQFCLCSDRMQAALYRTCRPAQCSCALC